MKIPLILSLIVPLAFSPNVALARHDDSTQNINVGEKVSDAKFGRWHEWQGQIEDRPIERIEAVLRREKGSKDTFVNLGFSGAKNFEPMRAYLSSDSTTTVNFDGRGERAGGRPLIMKAYNGEVYLTSLRVTFHQDPEVRDRDRDSRDRHDYRDDDNDSRRSRWSDSSGYGSRSDYHVSRIVNEIRTETDSLKSEVSGRRNSIRGKKLYYALNRFSDELRSFERAFGNEGVRSREARVELDDLFSLARDVSDEIAQRGFRNDSISYEWSRVEKLLDQLAEDMRPGRGRTIGYHW